jgi:hypothetical protein
VLGQEKYFHAFYHSICFFSCQLVVGAFWSGFMGKIKLFSHFNPFHSLQNIFEGKKISAIYATTVVCAAESGTWFVVCSL